MNLWVVQNFTVIVAAWLLLYGTGVVTGGTQRAGDARDRVCFMAARRRRLATPPAWGNIGWRSASAGCRSDSAFTSPGSTAGRGRAAG